MEKVILIQDTDTSKYFAYYGGTFSNYLNYSYQFTSIESAKVFFQMNKPNDYTGSVNYVSYSIEEFITIAMVNHLTFTSADAYGQLNCMDVYNVFGKSTDRVLNYLSSNPIIKVNVVGGRFGTYKGILNLESITCTILKDLCVNAWSKNHNRIKSLNQY